MLDLAEEFQHIPLIGSVIAAAFVLVVLELVAPWLADQYRPTTPLHINYALMFLPFLQIIGWVFAGAILFFGLVGAANRRLDSWLDRRRLNQQTGMDSIRRLSWREFERLLGEAFRRQGYQVIQRGGPVADGGVDLELRKDGETLLVQAKHWKSRVVKLPQLRELWGAVADEHADGGIMVTSGWFTEDARRWISGKNLTLLDGPQVNKLVRDVQRVGRVEESIAVAVEHRICPQCGSPMIIRIAKRGPFAGASFWGCARFPNCRYTESVEAKGSAGVR